MSIKDSLAKLDPANDEHWTDDGSPRMDVLQAQPGNSRLTRKQVTDADPSFSRVSVLDAEKVDEASDEDKAYDEADGAKALEVLEVAEVQSECGDSPEVMVEAQEPAGANVVVEVATLPATPEIATQAPETAVPAVLTEMQALQASLKVHEDAMLDADRTKEAANKAMKASSDAVNAINRKIEVLIIADPQAATAGIRDYINMQNKLRYDRAGRARRFMGDSGAKPSDVAKALEVRSPIDKAFLGRKPPRGTQRPQTRV